MINSRDIDDLHPTVARGARELLRRMSAKGQPALVTATYRDKAYQDSLYEQGRTKPGEIVTNARGGQSIHNYRLAFDICKDKQGQEYTDNAFFVLAGGIWQDMGGAWGGAWTTFPDKPHMEYTGGLTLSQLQAGHTLDQNAKMLWEKQTVDKEGEVVRRYQNYADLPEWAKPSIKKLMDRGLLKGTGQGLDLSEDMIRILVINDRAGLFDLKPVQQ